MKKTVFLLYLIAPSLCFSQENDRFKDYLQVVEKTGQEPVKFVASLLNDFDLLIFDDALHIAKEPFDFYQRIIRDNQVNSKIKYVFIEVFSIASQPFIDKYFDHATKDRNILLPVFQNDYSGYGWRYQTYLDLLDTIWEVNTELSQSDKIKVICVDQPIYWNALQTRKDYDLFLQSLIGRDYFMYKIISQTLENFNSKLKGIFLTNTRHAYKGIRKSNGEFYWNAGTFFNQWHPNKTFSIRLHNVSLSIKSISDSISGSSSAEGLEKKDYSWVRMDNGLWDKAFKENGNLPVGIPLKGNVFGKSSYIGNHMLDIADNQTMYDAYDGLIFLAPLEQLHFSAKISFIYTDSFVQELRRRILLLHGNMLADFLSENGYDSLDHFMEELVKYQGPKKNILVPKETN